MKTYTREELDEIIKKHIKWVRSEEGGERANLSGAYLSRANLSGAKVKETYFEPQSKYHVMHREDGMVKIGCKEKTIEQWDAFFASTDEYETKRGTDDFNRIHAHYLSVRAYVMAMKELK